eukprot:COSAG01_NODE_8399_length_2798_cov_4.786296_2_plen_72_part_01
MSVGSRVGEEGVPDQRAAAAEEEEEDEQTGAAFSDVEMPVRGARGTGRQGTTKPQQRRRRSGDRSSRGQAGA